MTQLHNFYATIVYHLCFFFSSRRRHTRLQGDWSSDVCSSDLLQRHLDVGAAPIDPVRLQQTVRVQLHREVGEDYEAQGVAWETGLDQGVQGQGDADRKSVV